VTGTTTPTTRRYTSLSHLSFNDISTLIIFCSAVRDNGGKIRYPEDGILSQYEELLGIKSNLRTLTDWVFSFSLFPNLICTAGDKFGYSYAHPFFFGSSFLMLLEPQRKKKKKKKKT